MILLLGLVLLTSPNGNPIWFVPQSVVTVRPAPAECASGSRAIVVTLSGNYCIVEAPETAAQKLAQ